MIDGTDMSWYPAQRCRKCGRADPPCGFGPARDWCRSCDLLLHDPWLTRKCDHCHRSVTKDVGQHAGSTPPGTGRWRHPGALLPYGGPDRAASLIQHFDAGHRIYDLGATEDLTEAEYAARIEKLRARADVQGVLRRVGALPPLRPQRPVPPKRKRVRGWLRMTSGRPRGGGT